MTPTDFETRLLKAFPLEQWSKRRVCLAVSGGADSVALLRAFVNIAEQNNIKKNLFVVTVDHGLRGQESTDDALFVQHLACEHGLETNLRRIDREELAEEIRRQGSLESGARALRYRLLLESAQNVGARFIATAHHRDDQLETILFRLFRGSSLDGLRGIAPYRALDESLSLVRPLLSFSKEEILEYLQTLGQAFRTDSSNASTLYDRNRIRLELVPMLDAIFPNRWQKALLRLAKMADETETYFDEQLPAVESKIEEWRQVENAYEKVLSELNVVSQLNSTSEKDVVELPIQAFEDLSDELVKRYLKKIWKEREWGLADMGAEEWERLAYAAKKGRPIDQLPNNVFVTFPNETTMRLERKRR